MTPDQREKLRHRIVAQRDELLARNNDAAEATRPVTLDQASVGRLSRMDAMQMQAMALEEQRRREQQLKRIDAVLDRIDDEDYGLCIDCDEPIALARLELDPTASLCIGCAAKREA